MASQEKNTDKHLEISGVAPSSGVVRFLPWIVLLIFLVLTYQLWQSAQHSAKQELQSYFDFRARETNKSIEYRMQTYEQILRGVQGLFVATENPGRKEFRAYVNTLELEKNYPGIQAVELVQLIRPSEKDKHIKAVRDEGFPSYSIKPEGIRDIYTAVTYIEPDTPVNMRALGYDMCTEPIRGAAAKKACDLGTSVISGKIQLLQENDGKKQSGFLMCLPIYKYGSSNYTEIERRNNIRGWIIAPFRMGDLMKGIFGIHYTELEIMLYDGQQIQDASLMYDSDHSTELSHTPRFQSVSSIEIANHTWTVLIKSKPTLEAQLDKNNPRIIMFAGTGLSLLLALLVNILVTGRVKAERLVMKRTASLREKEAQLTLAIEESGVGLWDWNIQTGETYFSERWAQIIGYTLKELEPTDINTWIKLCHPDDLKKSDELIKKHFAKKMGFYESESRMRHKEGHWVWVLDRGKVTEWDKKGKPLRMTGTHLDINKRKLAENALTDRTVLLTNLLDSITDIVFFKNLDGRYLGCNPAFAQFVGRSQAEIVNATDYDLFGKDVAAQFRENDRLMMELGESRHNEEWIEYPDKRRILIDTLKSPLRSADGECIGLLGVSRDITARKQTEEELQYHNKLSRLLLSISDEFINMPIAAIDSRIEHTIKQIGEFMSVDRSYVFLFDSSNSHMNSIYEWYSPDIAQQKDKPKTLPGSAMQWWLTKLNANEVIKLNKISDLPEEATPERTLMESQNIKSLLAVPINGKNALTGFLGFDSVNRTHLWSEESIILIRMVSDIISNALDRKQQVEKLFVAGRNFDIFFNTIEDLLFVMNIKGEIIHLNDTAQKRLGYSKEELTGKSILTLHPPERREETWNIVNAMLEGKMSFCPVPVVSKDGGIISVETRVIRGEWNGCPALFGVTKDVSALKLSEEKFSRTFHLASVPMSISIIESGYFLEVNEAFLALFGFSQKEVIGKTSLELNLFNDINDRKNLRDAFEKNGNVNSIEIIMRKSDSSKINVLFSATSITVNSQRCWLTNIVDITELKQTEKKLRESEEKILLLLNSTGEGIYGLDLDGNCTFCNQSCLRLLGFSNPNELLNKNMHWQIHHKHQDGTPFPIEECRIFKAIQNRNGTHVDDEVLWRADGSSFPAEYWAYPQYSNGLVVGAVVTFYDITERKDVEHQLKENLREKEMLLREIHHRVKNNMAVVSSLLALQADVTTDKIAKEMLEESQQRIKSMALVHEKLYKSRNMANIDFEDYVTTIVTELRSAYTHAGKEIKSTISAKGIALDIDRAIPCGLILNELVTNALKYAFTENKTGVLNVSLTLADNIYTLRVKDNGVGLPSGFDYTKTNSLGFQIVYALVKQLKGKLQLSPPANVGTEVTITFQNKGPDHA